MAQHFSSPPCSQIFVGEMSDGQFCFWLKLAVKLNLQLIVTQNMMFRAKMYISDVLTEHC